LKRLWQNKTKYRADADKRPDEKTTHNQADKLFFKMHLSHYQL
jgi:hypothetical protein